VTASNWSASEFHWPHTHGEGSVVGDGLGSRVWGVPGEKGAVSWQMLYMLLAGSRFHAARPGNESATGNVYVDAGWPMQDDDYFGQQTAQVACAGSHRRPNSPCAGRHALWPTHSSELRAHTRICLPSAR
jgi:hypothetical protein